MFAVVVSSPFVVACSLVCLSVCLLCVLFYRYCAKRITTAKQRTPPMQKMFEMMKKEHDRYRIGLRHARRGPFLTNNRCHPAICVCTDTAIRGAACHSRRSNLSSSATNFTSSFSTRTSQRRHAGSCTNEIDQPIFVTQPLYVTGGSPTYICSHHFCRVTRQRTLGFPSVLIIDHLSATAKSSPNPISLLIHHPPSRPGFGHRFLITYH